MNIFNGKLEKLGVFNSQEEEYGLTGYKIRNQNCYCVTDSFPKITSVNLNESIFKVSYEISLAGCLKYKIDSEILLNSFFND